MSGLSREHDPRCIVCKRHIPKRWRSRAVYTHADRERGLGGRDDATADLRTVDEVRRITNAPHIKNVQFRDGFVRWFDEWDGESYKDKFFCTQTCAVKQGYASAQHGARFNWRK